MRLTDFDGIHSAPESRVAMAAPVARAPGARAPQALRALPAAQGVSVQSLPGSCSRVAPGFDRESFKTALASSSTWAQSLIEEVEAVDALRIRVAAIARQAEEAGRPLDPAVAIETRNRLRMLQDARRRQDACPGVPQMQAEEQARRAGLNSEGRRLQIRLNDQASQKQSLEAELRGLRAGLETQLGLILAQYGSPGARAGHVSNHVVFVIDRSGSMGIADSMPTQRVADAQANRLGCVYESIRAFIRKRRAEHAGGAPEDSVSLVLFNYRGVVAIEAQRMDESVLSNSLNLPPEGGTDYVKGLEAAAGVLERAAGDPQLAVKRPVIIFLSDGAHNGAHNGAMDPVAKASQLKERFPELVIHCIKFVEDADAATLARMAGIGGGSFHISFNGVGLNHTFEVLADNMRAPIPALVPLIP